MNPKSKNPPPAGPEDSTITAETAHPEPAAPHDELTRQKDLNLRLTADFENFKRRSRQESESRAAAQKESLIEELLHVIDNLERAPASPQFHQGVEMVHPAGLEPATF